MKKKVNFHRSEGQRCFNEANKICLLIPNVHDRKVAQDLFAAAIAASMSGKSWSAIVAGLGVMLVQYGLSSFSRI